MSIVAQQATETPRVGAFPLYRGATLVDFADATQVFAFAFGGGFRPIWLAERVGFRDDVDESTARKVVPRELPGSQVLDAVWSIRILRITCIPFDEIKQGKRIEDADEVRYVEVNSHVSLIVPGGFWKTTQLLKAVV